MENIVAKIDRGDGTAGKLLNDPALYDKLDRVLDKVDSIASSHRSRRRAASARLINDDGFYNDLRSTLAEVNSLVDAIQSGDGTAGKLIKDPTLFNTLDQATSEMQKLMYDIRHDPKKYLTINFRFF